MTLQDNSIDFTTLTWVKPELDETLKQARNALQGYVEEGENPAELRTCADLLHQVQGTLRMVELYGAAMVAEEMEQLARALMDKRVGDRDAAYAVLMQGIVQLPDYLERLQGGHRDIPIVLLPLLNQLRASRGEKDLNESVLFSPDLSRPLPASAQGPMAPLPQAELSRRAEALRGLFQGALLRWLKDDNSAATIRDLTDVCEQLVPITSAEPARRLFWVAAGTLDALARNAFPISTPLKQALAKIEREIKRLADGGDAAFRNDPPIELTKQLLYFVAHEGSDNGRIGEIRQVFGLSGSEPSEAELAHARGSLSGNNRALLETVAVAIKDDLLRVKDALDLHLRTPGATPGALNAQVEALDRVADTLGMLGLSVPRRVVQDQRTAVNDVVSGLRKDDEATLLDIAGALLYVEAALDDQVERLGREGTQASDPATGNESRRLLEVLVKEAIVNFAQARQAFVGFVETHWDHQQLAEVPRLLNEVSGALRILNVPVPADFLVGIRQFTENELLQRKQVPNGQQMDRLADALASLEYFLEALRDRRPNREQILEVARQSLTALGYWPLSAAMRAAPVRVAPAPAAPAPSPVASAPPAPAAEPEVEIASSVEAAQPQPAAAPAAAEQPVPSAAASAFAGMVGDQVPGFDASSSEEIDDEIREVFLEEFEEEIENLQQLLPPWQQDPANADLLRPIRRVFHTLKGSGRLVGAKALGEFSWKVEGMLNRVLDGSRPASTEVMGMVQLALQHLPLLRAALQGQQVYADLEGIQAVADQLAAGEDVVYRSPLLAGEAEVAVEAEAAEAAEAEVVAEAPAEEPLAMDAESDEAPVFSIDPVLLEILKPEVAGHLETVDAWLAACAARGPQPVTDPLLRSIHTMNGAFAMTEVMSITDVTAPLEGYVKRSLAHNLVPGEAGVALVADAARAIRATVQAIEKPRPVLPHFSELAARAVSLRDTLPDSMLPSVPVHVDDEPMPQVVEIEAADTSAIPDFEAQAAALEVEAEAFEAKAFDAEAFEAEAFEADTRAFEAEAVAFEAEAEVAEATAFDESAFAMEFPASEPAPAEELAEPWLDAAAMEASAAAAAALEPAAETAAAMDLAAGLSPAVEEWTLEVSDETPSEPVVEEAAFADAAEAPFEDSAAEASEQHVEEVAAQAADEAEEAVAGEALEFAEGADLAEAAGEPAFDAQFEAETEATLEAEPLADVEPVAEAEPLVEAEATVITAEYPLPDLEPALAAECAAPAESESAPFVEESTAPAPELSDFAAEFEPSDTASAEADAIEAALAEAGQAAPVELEPVAEMELAPEAAAWDADAEEADADEVVAHAELPEDDLLSLEDFLRQASEQAAAFVEPAQAGADEPLAEAADETLAADAHDSDAAMLEAERLAIEDFAAAEAAEFAEAQSLLDAQAGDGLQAFADADVVAETEAAPFDASAFEAADLPVAGNDVVVEYEALEAAGFADLEPAAEAAPVADEGEDALAGMIAAYGELEQASDAEAAIGSEAPAEATADAMDFADDFLSADAASALPAGDFLEAREDVLSAEIEPIDAPVAMDEMYYGKSLAELEALTAPSAPEPELDAAGAEPMESREPLDVSLVGDVPTWTGIPAVEPEAIEAADAGVPVEAEAEAEAELAEVSEAGNAVEAQDFVEAAEVVEAPEAFEAVEAVEADAVVEADEASEAAIEVAEAPEPVEAAEAPEAIEADAVPEAVELAEAPAALEVVDATEEVLVFADEPEEPAAAEAPAPAAVVERLRPRVPMAQDAADPDADLDMTDLDPELLDLFLEESIDILDHSDGVLARLRDAEDDRESITTLQRDLHTLKGGARMAGIYAVGELGHAMESLLESVAEGRQQLDATGVVVLERGFDRLHGMVARIGERKAIALPAGLIAQVEALSEGRSIDEDAGDAAAMPADADAATAAAPVARPAAPSRPLSAPMDELEDELTGVRAPQEQVRIRADLLDRLVNYAGEVAIYRARLEQQLGAFRANLGELNQTTTRLREQLRRLDIETEAQIVARYQREEAEKEASFDPLELDRFTNQQQLTRALNESANDLVNLQGSLDDLTRQYETLLLQQSRVSSDLQEGLMRTRMVPFDALVPRLRRVLRQAATDTGKQVQLKVDGASGEMDRSVLERMTAPLEHMLRNAMAHGLEMPADRKKLHKPEEGTVRIQVQREGSEVVLKVSDDGRGLDRDAIRAKAIERGVLKADAEVSDEALYSLILETGFSTAENVSRLAGRGVGMDVVYSEIRQLGGTLQIKSEKGKGSEFVIRLPFTLAVTQAVFVKIGDTSFAVPIASVQGVGRISRADLDKQLVGENPVFQYAGEDYAIHDLGQLIGHAPAKAQDSLQMPLLLARSGDLRSAICIDQVLGSREIVVKPVGPQVNSVPGIFGATIMGDGRVVVILDVAPLVRRQGVLVREARESGIAQPAAPAPVAARRVPVVMVVDDSITMRKVTGRVLERNNMEVLTAKDGVDAVEKMAERVPDLVLLDIEMPRMDGYEVAQNMKSDPRLRDVPIIMITSRTGEKHRQRAMDIGVDRYLGKPYQEPELMRNVFEMLRMEAVSG